MTHIDAYRKGYTASQRTTTGDLEAAEGRFVARHKSAFHADFVDGWTDHAAGNGYNPTGNG